MNGASTARRIPMISWSDPALRRAAVTMFGASVFLFLSATALTVVASGRHASRRGSGETVLSDLTFLYTGMVFIIVGFLIARRQPRNRIGWLLASVGGFWAIAFATDSYANFGVNVEPGSLPAPALVMALGNWTWLPAIGLMAIFVVLLFPDGHLPSPGWRWLAGGSCVVLVFMSFALLTDPHAFDDGPIHGTRNPLALHLGAWWRSVGNAVFIVFALCILASAVAVVRRYRRSSGVERLQMKWLAAMGALFALFFGGMLLLGLVPAIHDNASFSEVVNAILPVTLGLVPLAIGAAILRYRLYEIDVVINKSLVLGALATFITTVYVAIVVGLGHLLGGGDRPNLALSIAATAVVAVAFQPVRERVQRVANRLVYGERATPYEVLSDFADRVGGTYDVAELLPTMAQTLFSGLGAAYVEVWLAGPAGLVREAVWPTSDEEHAGPDQVSGLSDLRADRVVEVRHQGELLGALSVLKPPGETLTPAEEKLLEDVAAQAGLVLRNVRLIEDLRSSRQRLVSTQDEERRRLERNLHDGAQQSLVAVALMIQTARARLGPEELVLGPALDQAAEQLREAIEELRDLARGIHPAILTERGLGAAVRALADRSPVPVVVEDQAGRLPGPVEASLYFVVAEALTNVAKYAHAAQATVRLTRAGGSVAAEVSDDGIGGADPSRGSGLRGLADRVAVVDGTLRMQSIPGGGTTLTCTVPVHDASASSAGSSSVSEPAMAVSP